MESDPVNPHHGTWMDQSNFIMQQIDFHHMTQKCPHCMYYGPSQKQLTWVRSHACGGDHPTITLLCVLLALCISARDLATYENTPLKKFMIIMDYLQDEHTTWYIL